MLQIVIDAALLNRQNLEMEKLVIKQGIITNDFSYVWSENGIERENVRF